MKDKLNNISNYLEKCKILMQDQAIEIAKFKGKDHKNYYYCKGYIDSIEETLKYIETYFKNEFKIL